MLKIDWTKTLSPGLPNTPPHYNGAPSQDFLIARSHPETRDTTLDLIRWGLLPSWAKDQKIAWRLINARAETVATASAFKQAFAKRRCLVPVDGFYEWKKVGKEKRPYLIGMANGEPFTLAGLWENWKGSCLRRVDPNIDNHHHRRERPRARVARPHACGDWGRRPRPLAQWRRSRRAAGAAQALPCGADDRPCGLSPCG